MKVTLEFDLSTQRADFYEALEGHKWKQVAETMRLYLRDKIERDEFHDAVNRRALNQVSEMLYQIVDDNGLSFD